LERHRVLRFVGGYPLPPDLNLKAVSVRKALAALGEHVVLATLNVDVFRTHFITEDQARDILGPMDHALECRRESGDMDSDSETDSEDEMDWDD
jgi:hypothetical protein